MDVVDAAFGVVDDPPLPVGQRAGLVLLFQPAGLGAKSVEGLAQAAGGDLFVADGGLRQLAAVGRPGVG